MAEQSVRERAARMKSPAWDDVAALSVEYIYAITRGLAKEWRRG